MQPFQSGLGMGVVAAIALSPKSAVGIPLPAGFSASGGGLVVRCLAAWQFNSSPSNTCTSDGTGLLSGEWYDCESAEHVAGGGEDDFTVEVYATLADGSMVLCAKAFTKLSSMQVDLLQIAGGVLPGTVRHTVTSNQALPLQPAGVLNFGVRTVLSHISYTPQPGATVVPNLVQSLVAVRPPLPVQPPLPPVTFAPHSTAPPSVPSIIAPGLGTGTQGLSQSMSHATSGGGSDGSFPFAMVNAKAQSWVGFDHAGARSGSLGLGDPGADSRPSKPIQRLASADDALQLQLTGLGGLDDFVIPSSTAEEVVGEGEAGADFVIFSGAPVPPAMSHGDSLGLREGGPTLDRTGTGASGVSDHGQYDALPGIAAAASSAWPTPSGRGSGVGAE